MSSTPAAASVALTVVVGFGILLFRRWRRAHTDAGVGGGAERRMRPAVVAAHGVAAAATVGLVLANVFVD